MAPGWDISRISGWCLKTEPHPQESSSWLVCTPQPQKSVLHALSETQFSGDNGLSFAVAELLLTLILALCSAGPRRLPGTPLWREPGEPQAWSGRCCTCGRAPPCWEWAGQLSLGECNQPCREQGSGMERSP